MEHPDLPKRHPEVQHRDDPVVRRLVVGLVAAPDDLGEEPRVVRLAGGVVGALGDLPAPLVAVAEPLDAVRVDEE